MLNIKIPACGNFSRIFRAASIPLSSGIAQSITVTLGRSAQARRTASLPSLASPTTEISGRSEEHTSELQSHHDLVCRLLLEKKKGSHKSATCGIPSVGLTPDRHTCSALGCG